MPEYALWTLIISLIILSLGLTYEPASLKHSLKLINKENNRFVEQINMVKQDKDKSVSALSELYKAETEKIIQEYETQIKQTNENMREILDKYHRLVSPAKLAFLEQWGKKKHKIKNP